MIPVMSKQKKQPATDAKKPNPILYLRLDDDTEAALQAFLARQEVKPDRTAVGMTALHQFLAKHNLWPYPPKPRS